MEEKKTEYIRIDSFYIVVQLIVNGTRTMRNNLYQIKLKQDGTPAFYFYNKKTVHNELEKVYASLNKEVEKNYNAEMLKKYSHMKNAKTDTSKIIVNTKKRCTIHRLLREGYIYRLRYVRYDYRNDVMIYGFYYCNGLKALVDVYEENNLSHSPKYKTKYSEERKYRRSIHFLEEKKWIMAKWFKSNPDITEVSTKLVYDRWLKYWGDDFLDENGNLLQFHENHLYNKFSKQDLRRNNIILHERNDKFLQEVTEWISDKVENCTLDEIDEERMQCRYSRKASKNLKQKAKKLGYSVQRASIKKQPYTIGGFAVFEIGNPVPVFGRRYTATYWEVCKFLDTKIEELFNSTEQ